MSAKITITAKSFTTVTPIAVWVKGPLALNSLMMAMADAGDLAMAMVPPSMEMASLAEAFIPCVNTIRSEIR